MADINQWVGVAGAGIGGLFTFLGVGAGAIVKHFSDIRQKQLERQWKLADQAIEQQKANDAEKNRRRDEILADMDKFNLLRLDICAAKSNSDGFGKLQELGQWLRDHALLLRHPRFATLFGTFLTKTDLDRIVLAGTNDLEILHMVQATLRDDFSPNTLYSIVSE